MHYGMWRTAQQYRHRRVWWGYLTAIYNGTIWAPAFHLTLHKGAFFDNYVVRGNENTR